MKRKEVFESMEVEDIPEGEPILECRWIFTEKMKKSGIVRKARLVVKGYMEIKGIHFWETFAPTCKIKTLKILLAYAAYNGWDYTQIDITAAFLHAPIKEEIYIRYIDSDGKEHYARLKKNLYGLKQAPREWHFQVVQRMEARGFRKADVESCLWIRKDAGKPVTLGLVHVDDFLIFYKDEKWKEDIINHLKKNRK